MISQISSNSPLLLGFDPGRYKCGLALMDLEHHLLSHEVIPADHVLATLETLCASHRIALLIMGDQTTSQDWRRTLQQALGADLNIIQVDERFSSLEARERYWDMYPPSGLGALIPRSLRSIPKPIDDIVAIILIERYLASIAKETPIVP